MRTQTEADSTFLDLVQGSLQASAKEAERIASLTNTPLVRSPMTEPAVPKELAPVLPTLGKPGTLCHDKKGRVHE